MNVTAMHDEINKRKERQKGETKRGERNNGEEINGKKEKTAKNLKEGKGIMVKK